MQPELQSINTGTGYDGVAIAPDSQKVLRNTYLLLALTMVPTILGASLGVATKFSMFAGSPLLGFMLFLGIAIGFFYGIEKTKNSVWGVVLLLGFTFFMGLMLSGLLGRVMSLKDGGTLIATAAGGTGLIFFAMASLAATIKRDLSGMGKFLIVGALLLLVAVFANIFLQIPALSLTIMVLAIGIFSAFLLYDINRIITGGETNYVTATLSIYLDIYNVFSNLLALLGITSSD